MKVQVKLNASKFVKLANTSNQFMFTAAESVGENKTRWLSVVVDRAWSYVTVDGLAIQNIATPIMNGEELIGITITKTITDTNGESTKTVTSIKKGDFISTEGLLRTSQQIKYANRQTGTVSYCSKYDDETIKQSLERNGVDLTAIRLEDTITQIYISMSNVSMLKEKSLESSNKINDVPFE